MAENPIKAESTELSIGYWQNWIIGSMSSAKQHWDTSTRAWNEFLLAESAVKGASDTTVNPPARFPLFWSSIKNLQPAYYARTPETVARRMFDSEDHVARVSCIILERLSKYSMSQYPIDDAMIHGTLDFLIADKATARIYYEDVKEKFTEEIQVFQAPTGEFVDINTGEIVLEDAEIKLLEDGVTYTATITKEQLVKVCTDALPVPFSDILHTPNAQSWCDVKTVAFRLWLNKQEFAEKFGSSKLNKVMFGKQESKSDTVTKNENESQAVQKVGEGVEIWEVWDKPTKKVMYVSRACADEFLLVLDDPYELRDFFPCTPFIIGTKPPKSLYPTPMYKQLEPLIDQLHRLFTRITRMTSSLRVRGIADKAMTDVIEAINQLDDFEVMGSSHFAQLVESKAKGADPIWYLPLNEIAQALAQAQELLASYKQLFFEISGVPDVVRGVTDARETASAQQAKGQFYNVRSSWDQHLIQEMARKLIEMQCDLALARMPETMIIEVCHLQSLQQEDQPYVNDALALLKNDKQRSIRIDIETDSLTFVQNEKKQEQKNLIVQTVMQGLTQVAQISKESPEFMRPAMQMLLMSLRGVDLGKDYEQSVESAMKGLEEASKQPPPPPPPDYEAMKLQVAQQKMQSDQQLASQKGQIDMAKLQMEQADQQFNQQKEQFDQWMRQQELSLKTQEIQLKAQQVAQDQQLEGVKVGLNKQLEDVYAQMEQQKLEIEAYRVQMSEREKLMEERRLDQQKVTDQISLLQQLSQEPKESSSQQPVVVNLNTASSKKITMQRDPLSGALVGTSEVIQDV